MIYLPYQGHPFVSLEVQSRAKTLVRGAENRLLRATRPSRLPDQHRRSDRTKGFSGQAERGNEPTLLRFARLSGREFRILRSLCRRKRRPLGDWQAACRRSGTTIVDPRWRRRPSQCCRPRRRGTPCDVRFVGESSGPSLLCRLRRNWHVHATPTLHLGVSHPTLNATRRSAQRP